VTGVRFNKEGKTKSQLQKDSSQPHEPHSLTTLTVERMSIVKVLNSADIGDSSLSY